LRNLNIKQYTHTLIHNRTPTCKSYPMFNRNLAPRASIKTMQTRNSARSIDKISFRQLTDRNFDPRAISKNSIPRNDADDYFAYYNQDEKLPVRASMSQPKNSSMPVGINTQMIAHSSRAPVPLDSIHKMPMGRQFLPKASVNSIDMLGRKVSMEKTPSDLADQ